MRRNLLQKTIRPMMYVAILGLALTALTGCGMGHGPYRHGYNTGYNDVRNGGYYRTNVPYGTMYGPNGGDYMPGYGGYCGW